MIVYLSNRPHEFPDNSPLGKVLGEKDIPKILACWINGKPVPKEELRTRIVHDGDRIRVQRVNGEIDLVYNYYIEQFML